MTGTFLSPRVLNQQSEDKREAVAALCRTTRRKTRVVPSYEIKDQSCWIVRRQEARVRVL